MRALRCCGLIVALPLIVSTPFESLAQNKDNEDVLSVFERYRPDYNADGIKSGAFIMHPRVNLDFMYDDNIFADDTNEEQDLITSIKPAFRAESNWSRHKVYLNLGANIVKYLDNSDEDFQDYSASVGGRLDVVYNTYFTGDVTAAVKHEDRSSPNDVNGVEPTKYTDHTAKLGFVRDVGLVSLYLDTEAEKFNYDNVQASGGGVINNSIRDRDEYRVQMKIAYEYIPNYEAYFRSSYNWRKYDITTPLNRDSNGYQLNIGTDVNLTGKLKGDVFAGYFEQDYEDPTLTKIDGTIFGASVLWNVTQLTSLKAGFSQAIRETIVSSSAGYLSTELFAEAEHELRRNILLGATLKLGRDDFKGGSGTQREDEIINAGVSAKYLLRRGVNVKAGYNFLERDSNAAGADFTDNRIMLNLGLEI